MEKIDFSLSYKNYFDLPLDKYNKDFIIYVNNKPYQTSRMIADLLSPNLRKMHHSDESVTEISIYPKEKEQDGVDYFQDFLNIPILHNCTIDLQHRIHYAEYFYILGNYDETINIQKENFKNITIENAVERLLFVIETMERIPYEYFDQISPLNLIITFISSHFEEIKPIKLKKLPIEIIQLIIQNESLKISNEYSLFSFIFDLYNEDHNNSFLFEFVFFENIENEVLDDFLDEFDTDYLTRPLWKKLKSTFFKSTNKKENKIKKRRSDNGIDYRYRYTKEFDAIDDTFRFGKDWSSESNSDASFNEILSNLNYADQAFYGTPNYDNNQVNNSSNSNTRNNRQNGRNNRHNNTNDNQLDVNGYDDELFLTPLDNFSDDGWNRHEGNVANDRNDRNNNRDGINLSLSTDDDDDDDVRDYNDNEGSDDDDDDDDDGRGGGGRGGSLSLSNAVRFAFRRMRNLDSGYVTKTVCCLYRVASIMADICEQNIPHQILKTNSILVNNDFEPDLSMIISNNASDVIEKASTFNIFWAPEIIHNFVITEKSDVYSFSIICFFMFTGFCPFHEMNLTSMIHMVETSRRDTIPRSVPRAISDLIESCWIQSPNSRPSFRDILNILGDPSIEIDGLDREIFNRFIANDNTNERNENIEDNENNANNENIEDNANNENNLDDANNENIEDNANNENNLDDVNNENNLDDVNNENNLDDANNENNLDDVNNENNLDDVNNENNLDDVNNENNLDDVNNENNLDNANNENIEDNANNENNLVNANNENIEVNANNENIEDNANNENNLDDVNIENNLDDVNIENNLDDANNENNLDDVNIENNLVNANNENIEDNNENNASSENIEGNESNTNNIDNSNDERNANDGNITTTD